MSDLSRNGQVVVGADVLGRMAMGLDPVGPTERVLAVNAAGALLVVAAPAVLGGDIVDQADVAVGVGVTIALGAIPANVLTATIQNTASGSLVRIRKVGGAAGSGILLGYREVHIYSEAITAMEAECIGAVASTVAVQYETA